MRYVKEHPVLSVANSFLVDSPLPANISYLWNTGSLLGMVLIIQIATGVTLAMHYTPHTALAFASVEHIMRDVNYGWILRYLHANGASFFFIVVYLHIGRGIYYGSYRPPRTLLWTVGVVIYIIMMATAFLGYVLPWGCDDGLIFFLPMLKSHQRVGPHNQDVLALFVGTLLGDGYAEERSGSTRICLKQSSKHVGYLHWCHEFLAVRGYCNPDRPKLSTQVGKEGKIYYYTRVNSYSFKSLNFLRNEFYPNGVKVVPLNIEEMITPLGLAVWLNGSSNRGYGVLFHTCCFTLEDVQRLQSALYCKWNIKSSVHVKKGQPNLHIMTESKPIVRELVSPYLHVDMLYKLGKE